MCGLSESGQLLDKRRKVQDLFVREEQMQVGSFQLKEKPFILSKIWQMVLSNLIIDLINFETK